MALTKHIVIDARLYGTSHTGIGRYTKNLLLNLPPRFHYTLLIYPELATEIKHDLGTKFSYLTTNIRHYSFTEQLKLPLLLASLKPDLVHFTHFSKPIFYFGRSIVTVHDLIRHSSRGIHTTTKNPLIYWFKYLGYLIQSQIIFKRDHIIVPSHYWRNHLINHYHINPSKITTTHEAVDPKFLSIQKPPTTNPKSYIVYTGNLYPHKNLSVVLQALKSLPHLKLKIICSRSVFKERIHSPQVEFLGFIKDEQFRNIYQSALALVHPALIEGFSLTGLEAMALNCPVIASNSTCIPEIYGPAALYFDPHSPSQLTKQIKTLIEYPRLRHTLISLGHQQIQKYSWAKTASETAKTYEQILA